MKREEAIEIVRKLYNESLFLKKDKEAMVTLIPELKESEDEKVEQAIFGMVYDSDNELWSSYDVSKSDVLAWLEKQGEPTDINPSEFDLHLNKLLKQFETLPKEELASSLSFYLNVVQNDGTYKDEEKQGEQKETLCDKCRKEQPSHSCQDITELGRCAVECEQKPADKVEPKFKVGDWVIDKQGIVHQIANVVENVTNHTYGYDIVGGGYFNDNTEGVRRWTLQNAKDGDVLAVDNMIFIYKRTLASHIVSYCKLNNDIFEPFDDARTCCEGNPYVHPATKEQREQLVKAMVDAGYSFGFEKKGLMKIGQDSAWGEEDDIMKQQCHQMLALLRPNTSESTKDIIDNCHHWLKSLKERVQPQNNITDEELAQAKKDAYNNALDKIEYHSGEPTFDDGWSAAIWYLKKRNAQPQNTWKPSEEQIEALAEIVNGLANNCGEECAFDLRTLQEELKKLREE